MELLFFLLFITLTSLGLFLRLRHANNRLMFWAAAVVVCCGLVGLQVILEKSVLPMTEAYSSEEILLSSLYTLTGVLNWFINTFPYYGVLVFYLLYNGLMRFDRWMISLLSLPMWISLLTADLPANRLNMELLPAWGAAYVLGIVFLACLSVMKEKEARQRLNHIAVAVIFAVPMIVLNVFHFAASYTSDRILVFIPFLLIISLVILVSLYVRGAFLGAKRRSVQTIHVGTGLIHHSLKNSIGKVKLNALNIRKSLEKRQYDEADAFIDNLLSAHESMIKTMSKISQAVSDKMVLHKEKQDLSAIVEEVAAGIRSYPHIEAVIECAPIYAVVDRQLLAECLQNIVNNAIEAMREKGSIHIALTGGKRKAWIAVSDTGNGMSSVQLHNVFEPFYSTKQRTRNHFGLGMYQVKKVMEAHDGRVEIKSAPGKGTTVSLIFKR